LRLSKRNNNFNLNSSKVKSEKIKAVNQTMSISSKGETYNSSICEPLRTCKFEESLPEAFKLIQTFSPKVRRTRLLLIDDEKQQQKLFINGRQSSIKLRRDLLQSRFNYA
jgi:hypothetical protein